jgi:hypothetical protein
MGGRSSFDANVDMEVGIREFIKRLRMMRMIYSRRLAQ